MKPILPPVIAGDDQVHPHAQPLGKQKRPEWKPWGIVAASNGVLGFADGGKFFFHRCVRGQHGGRGLAQAANQPHRQAAQDEAGHDFVQAQPAKLLPHQHGDRPDDDAGQRTVARHALPRTPTR